MCEMDLITEFHHFGGSSIAEHKQQFCRYIKKMCALEVTDRIHILNALNGHTRLEELFVVKLLLKFQHTEKLLEIIPNGDRILNNLIFTHKPFVFVDFSPDFYINELFPQLSFLLRNRCIKNIANATRNDHVGEDFFKQVSSKYGMKAACPLLLACSEEFIRNALFKYWIDFSERQLIKLHQRFGQSFLQFYYNELKKQGKPLPFHQHPLLARYLAVQDTETFHSLLQYGKPSIGKRGFIKFLHIAKQQIIADPLSYASMIHRRAVYKHLQPDEFKEFIKNMLPSIYFNIDLNGILKYISLVPASRRFKLISEIYYEKVGCEIGSIVNSDLGSLLLLLPKADRHKFTMGDLYLEFQAVDRAFPKLRNLIDLTSDLNIRSELVLKMVKCAHNNDDEKALLDVLKFVCQRFKNDPSNVLSNILHYLLYNYQLDTVDDEIWDCMMEMTLTDELNRKLTHINMLQAWMSYRFTRGFDITEEFDRFVKYYGCHNAVLPSKNPMLQKWAIQKYPEVAARLFPCDGDIKGYPHAYLSLLRKWNRDNPEDTISYYKFPHFIDHALRNYTGAYYDDLLPNCIMIYTPEEPEERAKQEELLGHFDKFVHCESLWYWMLRNRLHQFDNHIHLMFASNAAITLKFCYSLSMLEFTGLPQEATSKALDILNWSQGDASERVCIYKRALLWLSVQSNFVYYTNKYMPKHEEKINVYDPDTRMLVSIREHLLDMLKNQVRMESVIDAALSFCYKDYFQRVLPTLTMILFHCPEGIVSNVITSLRTRSVTVRKRAIYFATALLSADKACKFLKQSGIKEKNKSLQKFLFQRTFYAFVNVCNADLWDTLMDHFKFVFEEDQESLRLVYSFRCIPREYLGQYITKVWNEIGKKWKHHYYRVLDGINADIMHLLPDALCDDIIQFSLASQSIDVSNIDFIYRYLLHSGDKLNYRFEIVANNARLVADETTQLTFLDYNKKAKSIAFLYEDICERLIKCYTDDLESRKALANKLHENFSTLALPYNQMEYHLRINVCLSFLEHGHFSPQSIVELQKEFIGENGELMFDYFNRFMKSQLQLIPMSDEHMRDFINRLIDVDCSTHVKLLALKLLPQKYPRQSGLALEFRNLIEKIEQNATPIVTCYLNDFLKVINLY